MAAYDPFGIYGGTTAKPVTKGSVASNYTGGTGKSNTGRVYDPFGINEQNVHTPIANDSPQQDTSSTPAPKKSTNILGKVKNFVGDNVVKPTIDTGEKSINTVAATGAGIFGLNKAALQAVTGNKKAAGSTIQSTNKNMDQFADKGVGGKGAYLSSKQASSQGEGKKGLVNNFVKPVAQGVTDIAPLVLPVGKTVKGASLLTKVGRGALDNAIVSGGATVANEGLNGQLTKDNGGQILKSVVTGAAAGALIPGLHEGVKAGHEAVTPTSARELIKNQKTQTLLDAGRTPPDTKPTYIPSNPKVKSLIEARQKQAEAMAAPAKAAQNEQVAAAKTIEDNHVQSQKIDRQIELIQAKKADGKFTNVDKVKVQQLKEDKQQLQPEAKVTEPPAPIVTNEKTTEAGVVPEKPVIPAKQQIDTIKADAKNYDAAGNLTPDAAKQINALNKGTRTPAAEKPISYTPIEEKPLNTPEIKTSKLAQGVEEKAIKKGLTQGFEGLPEYAKVNVADQAKAASGLLKSDPERLTRIALGHERPPEGLLPESAFVAIEKHAHKTGNVDLIRRLATESTLSSEATGMGQRIRMLAERNPHSAVTGIRKVVEARKVAAEAKLAKSGKTVSRVVNDTVREIKKAKATTMKVTRQDWHSFIEGIKC